MAVNGKQPFIHVEDNNGKPIVGAVLKVYEVTTTTYRAIYSDSSLSTPMTNPIAGANASDASGNFPVFYMAAGLYKLRAETSTGTLIWEWDNLDTGTSAGAGALPIANGGTGATTAAAARANLSAASTSDVTALAAQIAAFTASLQNTISQPQGRLTPTSLTPVITTGVTAGTAVYYTLYTGNLVPIYDGSQMNLKVFAELTLTLNSSYILNSHYDCFIINDAGTIRIVTGPAWATITAGAGARGTGAGTTELTRLNGLLVNANAMATARNGSSTYAVDANKGTYVGSIYIDGTAGQITCNTSGGQSRKWSIWNAYNRAPILLYGADPTASWTNTPTTWRQSRADATNVMTSFCGLPEETITGNFQQIIVQAVSSGVDQANIGFGLNVTNALTGVMGYAGFTLSASAGNATGTPVARVSLAPGIGINNFNAIEQAPNGTTSNTFNGTSANMRYELSWRG